MVELTAEFLADLQAKAERATPGDWVDDDVRSEIGERGVIPENQTVALAVTVRHWGWEGCPVYDDWANAAYIAAANPDTVTALIAEIRRLREREAMATNYLYQDATSCFEIEVLMLPSSHWCIVGTDEVGGRSLFIGGQWVPSRGISAEEASREYPTADAAFAALDAWKAQE